MTKNSYELLKEKHQIEYGNFPIYFAVGKEQIIEKFKELNLEYDKDLDKVVGVGNFGFVRKEDETKYFDMLKRHNEEIQKEISKDITGETFIKDMFLTELKNHEYSYTRDEEDTLEALHITNDDLIKHPNLMKGLAIAKKEIIDKDNEIDYEMEMD